MKLLWEQKINKKVWLAVWLAVVLVFVGRVEAQDSVVLSGEQEKAFQEALQSWTHFASVNAEIGLPPFGPAPERADFVN